VALLHGDRDVTVAGVVFRAAAVTREALRKTARPEGEHHVRLSAAAAVVATGAPRRAEPGACDAHAPDHPPRAARPDRHVSAPRVVFLGTVEA
jgi:hypothetical protein